jgi:hypothetical protein
MSGKLLYTYRCKCGTVAVASAKASYGDPWRCNLCRWPMRFLFSRPIETDEQRALADRGIVYNPGVSQEPTR